MRLITCARSSRRTANSRDWRVLRENSDPLPICIRLRTPERRFSPLRFSSHAISILTRLAGRTRTYLTMHSQQDPRYDPCVSIRSSLFAIWRMDKKICAPCLISFERNVVWPLGARYYCSISVIISENTRIYNEKLNLRREGRISR